MISCTQLTEPGLIDSEIFPRPDCRLNKRGGRGRGEGRQVRLLHTSDWHLGRRFYGRSLISDQAYVLDQMINLVRDLNPDVCLIVGDVFEQRRPHEDALELFHDTVGRLIDLGTTVVVLAGPTDDFSKLHLHARWVRQQGLYLLSEASQVLSPVTLRGPRDNFSVSAWCLPYVQPGSTGAASSHPAQAGRGLIETVVQRIDANSVNLFAGYVWAQGVGKRAELGTLVAPGGQPVEKRLFEYFDYCALGGCHQPLSLGPDTVRYSGGLLATEVESEDESLDRSVTFIALEGKQSLFVDEYPLRPRRAFRLLSGSVEELIAQGRAQRGDDLLVLRSNELELTSEQRVKLRTLGQNIVSVEQTPTQTGAESTDLLQLLAKFHEEMGGEPLDEDAWNWLKALQERM